MQDHVQALEATIAAAEPLQRPINSALVALTRTLSAQVAAAGTEPSTRLTAAYLSALKDIHRVVASAPPASIQNGKMARLRRMRADNDIKAVS